MPGEKIKKGQAQLALLGLIVPDEKSRRAYPGRVSAGYLENILPGEACSTVCAMAQEKRLVHRAALTMMCSGSAADPALKVNCA